MVEEVKREWQPSDEAIDSIPQFMKEILPRSTVLKLASVIDDSITKEPPMGEATYAGQSRATGYNSVYNAAYSRLGYYQTSDIPISVLDTMRRDSQVALAMAIIKYPITTLNFTVNCDNPTIKAFVDYNLRNKWSRFLRDALLALDYGFNGFEKVWNTKRISIDPGKNQRKIENEKFIVLEKLKPIHPNTLQLRLDSLNNFSGLVQTGSGRDVTLSTQKSMMFTYQLEYGNYFGRSRMVPAYEPWYWKIIATQFFLRWMERRSIPPYIVSYPTGMTNSTGGTQYSNSALALKLAQAIGAYGNVTLPSTSDDKGNKKWDISTIKGDSSQNLTLDTVVESVFNIGILRGMLVPDQKALGALDPSVASDLFLSTLEDIVVDIEAMVNRELVAPLVAWNFPKKDIVACTVNIDDIDFEKRQEMRKILMKFMDIIATFVKNTGGLPFDLLPDMNKIYEILDIPGKKAGIYQLPVYDSQGNDVTEKVKKEQQKMQNKQAKNAQKGPQKGERTPGNLSAEGRDGTPRNQGDKE